MGFGHNAHGIQNLCVELTAIIHANFHVAATISPAKRESSLYRDFDEHYESLINTKSIELAINLRALFDRCATISNPEPLKQAECSTTALTFLQGTGPTTLRECTNKIIHASYFEFQYGHYETDIGEQRFSNRVQESTVEIIGWFHEMQWKCKLDLLQFAEEAHCAASDLQNQYGQ